MTAHVSDPSHAAIAEKNRFEGMIHCSTLDWLCGQSVSVSGMEKGTTSASWGQ